MAGSTIAVRQKRAMSVRPQEENTNRLLQPVVEEASGDLGGNSGSTHGKDLVDGETETMEQLEKNYQDLKDKVEEYLDDENGKGCRQPPRVCEQYPMPLA